MVMEPAWNIFQSSLSTIHYKMRPICAAHTYIALLLLVRNPTMYTYQAPGGSSLTIPIPSTRINQYSLMLPTTFQNQLNVIMGMLYVKSIIYQFNHVCKVTNCSGISLIAQNQALQRYERVFEGFSRASHWSILGGGPIWEHWLSVDSHEIECASGTSQLSLT